MRYENRRKTQSPVQADPGGLRDVVEVVDIAGNSALICKGDNAGDERYLLDRLAVGGGDVGGGGADKCC